MIDRLAHSAVTHRQARRYWIGVKSIRGLRTARMVRPETALAAANPISFAEHIWVARRTMNRLFPEHRAMSVALGAVIARLRAIPRRTSHRNMRKAVRWCRGPRRNVAQGAPV